MSAFYTIAFDDRIELLTDGAVYDDDGTLTDIQRKVWTSPRLPMAVTGRGNNNAVTRLAEAFVMIASLGFSFDETIANIRNALGKYADHKAADDFEIVIAGISEATGPVIYWLASADLYGMGVESWTLYSAGEELGGGPQVDLAELDASGGLRGCGVELFEAMRRVPGPNPSKPDLPEIYGIGGHVDYTVVTADGVRTERLHTWQDKVGEKIAVVDIAKARL